MFRAKKKNGRFVQVSPALKFANLTRKRARRFSIYLFRERLRLFLFFRDSRCRERESLERWRREMGRNAGSVSSDGRVDTPSIRRLSPSRLSRRLLRSPGNLPRLITVNSGLIYLHKREMIPIKGKPSLFTFISSFAIFLTFPRRAYSSVAARMDVIPG